MPVILASPFCARTRATRLAHASVLAAALACPVAAAQESIDDPPAASWSLGVGAISRQKPYTGMSRDNMAIPFIRFENEYIQVLGPMVGLKLPSLPVGESQTIDVSLVARFDGSGYEASDAAILRGMSKRRGGFLAGTKLAWNTGMVDLSAEWLADVSGNSKGRLFSVSVEKTWHIGSHWMLTPRIGATWQDRKYVDYYYGVRQNEARASRPYYQGRSGMNAELGARAMYMFNERHALFLDVEASRLAKGIRHSPLVDGSTENRIFVGYLFRIR